MKDYSNLEVWFVTGSQHLYGEETLRKVAQDSQEIAAFLAKKLPVNVIFKPVVKTPEEITGLCLEANSSTACVGLITWMHTFSPAKMWISGLTKLTKPIAHLHTQFFAEIPWSEIDMDYMNLHQSAHGDREFGFIGSRLRLNRKVIVGHWQDEEVHQKLSAWVRVACAWNDWQGMKIARFGDNMRSVAVTEGDKVEAEIKLGFSVHGYGLGDLVSAIKAVGDKEIDALIDEYFALYDVVPALHRDGERFQSLREAAQIELGIRYFLEQGGFRAFTTTFEDLHGLSQLPGLAVQRLMADGYGFGAEGDWKTAALVRAMKVMSFGLEKGTSFMEDYTYHFSASGDKVLGAHMLEICSSIAKNKPVLEILPLSIGGKEDPVRLIFDSNEGSAVAASVVDMGNRFRLIVNEVDVVPTEAALPKLPVARAFWQPKPDLKTAAAAWILAGGAHHTGFSYDINAEVLEDFSEIADIEFILINNATTISELKKELRWNEAYFLIKNL
jgi:L-arabinose isomerase